jgi:hypothetical protein
MFPGKIIAPQRDRNPVTTMFFEIAPGTQVIQLEVSKIDEAEEDSDATRVAILKVELKKAEEKMQEKKKKKAVRFDGIDVPPLPSWARESKVANTTKATAPPMVPIARSPPNNHSSPTSVAPVMPNPTPQDTSKFSSDNSNPNQYKYQSAIEDPAVLRLLLDRSLDAPIQMTT